MLPYDYSRCAGRDLRTDWFCPDREQCQRYTTIAVDAVPDYRGISFAALMREPGKECEYMMREGE